MQHFVSCFSLVCPLLKLLHTIFQKQKEIVCKIAIVHATISGWTMQFRHSKEYCTHCYTMCAGLNKGQALTIKFLTCIFLPQNVLVSVYNQFHMYISFKALIISDKNSQSVFFFPQLSKALSPSMEVLDTNGNQKLRDSAFYYIHFKITGYPCNLICSRQCNLFTNHTILYPILHLFLANENGILKNNQSDLK